jgi:hypothetical protein
MSGCKTFPFLTLHSCAALGVILCGYVTLGVMSAVRCLRKGGLSDQSLGTEVDV